MRRRSLSSNATWIVGWTCRLQLSDFQRVDVGRVPRCRSDVSSPFRHPWSAGNASIRLHFHYGALFHLLRFCGAVAKVPSFRQIRTGSRAQIIRKALWRSNKRGQPDIDVNRQRCRILRQRAEHTMRKSAGSLHNTGGVADSYQSF